MPWHAGKDKAKSIYWDGYVGRIYLGSSLVYQSDSSAPTLTVSNPAGDSFDNPTYTGDSTYRVSGTVTDTGSGVKAVYVNDIAAIIDGNLWYLDINITDELTTIYVYAIDNAGNNSDVITRYIMLEPYYQQAARIAGTTPQNSLDATLKNSAVCQAIAGNETAYGIMAEHYKSDLAKYIDSNFSSGLNLLCYRCKAKTYLYRPNDTCSNVTGGWTNIIYDSAYSAMRPGSTTDSNTSIGYTTNLIDFRGFNKMYARVRYMQFHSTPGTATNARFGTYTAKTLTWSNWNVYTDAGTCGTANINANTDFSVNVTQGNYYAKVSANNMAYDPRFSYIWIE